ncbi:ABC transporter substrate-binding protein [bacterium]|nr:ABC transporter substrate-binding protein [bacterium]
MVRRMILLVGLIIVVILVAGCYFPRVEHRPGMLRVGLEGRPTNLDPRFATDAASSKLDELIFSSLLYKDGSQHYKGDLALSWQISDSRVYTFQLRSGVRFHDGSPLTAHSVKTTLDSVRAEGSRSPKRADFLCISRIEVLDETRLEIHLFEPFAPFLNSLTLGIIPEGVVEGKYPDFSEYPIGSGPFRVERHTIGRELVLRRNLDYYGDQPKLEGVHFKVISDGMIRSLELMKRTIDLTQNDIPPRFIDLISKQEGIVLNSGPSDNYTYLGFNLEHPVLGVREVRRAIALAINRAAIIERVFNGLALESTGLLPPDHWAYRAGVKSYSYDPKAATALLDQAGFPDPDGPGPQSRFELVYKTSQNPFRQMIATIIQRDLQHVGIAVKVQSLEWPTFYDDIKKGNFELFSLMWVGVDEPDLYYQLFHSSSRPPLGANRGHYHNQEVDLLLEQGRRELDRDTRAQLYGRVQEILAEDVPYVSLWHEYNTVAMSESVENYRLYANASYRGLLSASFRDGSQ